MAKKGDFGIALSIGLVGGRSAKIQANYINIARSCGVARDTFERFKHAMAPTVQVMSNLAEAVVQRAHAVI